MPLAKGTSPIRRFPSEVISQGEGWVVEGCRRKMRNSKSEQFTISKTANYLSITFSHTVVLNCILFKFLQFKSINLKFCSLRYVRPLWLNSPYNSIYKQANIFTQLTEKAQLYALAGVLLHYRELFLYCKWNAIVIHLLYFHSGSSG